MTAICPENYEIINGICYDNCPPFTEVYAEDYTICIQNDACPTGTTADSTGLQCNKVAPIGVVTKVGSLCSENYTEWTLNLCYINCPNDWMENGLACSRNVFLRNTTLPECNTFYNLVGNNCVFDWSEVFLIFIIILVLLYIFSEVTALRTPKSLPQKFSNFIDREYVGTVQ